MTERKPELIIIAGKILLPKTALKISVLFFCFEKEVTSQNSRFQNIFEHIFVNIFYFSKYFLEIKNSSFFPWSKHFFSITSWRNKIKNE